MLTLRKLIIKVREIVKERPDVKYRGVASKDGHKPNCFYDRGECSDGTVGCIFGQAAVALSVPIGSIQASINKLGIKGTDQERAWCQTVQCCQDRGDIWDVAVSKADEAVGEVHPI